MIDRPHYLEKLVQREKNGLVKVITGIRRCGKSYLLFKIFKDHLLSKGVKDDHIICVVLDDVKNKSLRDVDRLYAYINEKIVDKDQYYVFLDEIQFVDGFSDLVNGL
ncbi:MAG: AAA family ATPase, partial [Clostridia bacterium]|nr:AAA family ATPase [Clostridia bacterium]